MKRLRQICILGLASFLLTQGGQVTPAPLLAAAQGQEHHAGLVIQFSDGSIRQYCFAFREETISGLDLLLKSGLDVKLEAYGGMGGGVCKIEHDGCDYPGEACWCKSYGPGGVYWSYHHLKSSQWKSSVLGAASYKVHDGDVEGWAWSDGKAPPLLTFAQVCVPVEAAPTPTDQPKPATSTPTEPKQTATPQPRPTQGDSPSRPTGTVRRAYTASATAEPTSTALATAKTPITTPTQTATIIALPESSATATEVATVFPTPTGIITPVARQQITATPSTTPMDADDNSNSARMVAMLLGFGVALVFLLWRGSLTVRRPRDRGKHVD